MINHKDPFKIISEKRGLIPIPDVSSAKSSVAPQWYNEIVREYIEVDMHGYQEDKVITTKGRKQTFKNTTEDAFHTAFAATCNFFITNDKKTYFKAKEVYKKLGKNTIVMDPDEFVSHYRNFLDFANETVLSLLNTILRSDQFMNSEHVIIDPKLDKSAILLSQNAPTHNFLHLPDLEKLVSLVNELFGPDVEHMLDFKHSEMGNGQFNLQAS